MDPITAFAAAGNVLQFVQLGTTIIRKSIKYAASGGSHEHEQLRSLTQQLITSNWHLQNNLTSRSFGSAVHRPGPTRALYLANQTCLDLSQEFISFLHELKIANIDTPWKALRIVFRTLRHQTTISDYEVRVKEARSNLSISLLVYICSDDGPNSTISGTHQQILEEFRKAQSSSQTMKYDVDQLAWEFRNVRIDDEKAKKHFQILYSTHQKALGDLTNRLDDILIPLPTNLATLCEQLKQLEPLLDRDVDARRRIINSLHFDEMDDRRKSIAPAYKDTFKWILNHKENDDRTAWDDFLGWLEGGSASQMYWIRGKPGSGKSTLMRFLSEKVTSLGRTNNWCNGVELIQVSCYFWYAGTSQQVSLTGLLKSLLHQLFEARLDLVKCTASRQRWETSMPPSAPNRAWYDDELKETLASFVAQTKDDVKLLFLIDGLDEYSGSDEQREDMVHFFQKLTINPHLKVCFSSRPWNVYKDLFFGIPQLQLETLTRPDISDFVSLSLSENKLFQRQIKRHPQQLNKITEEIVERADGVFLWVRLVVSALLKIVRDGGPLTELTRELQNMPDDLDKFFMRMMQGIDKRYQKDASRIMQIALCDLESRSLPAPPRKAFSEPGFRLLDLYYLDEEGTTHFCLEPDFEALNYFTDDDVGDLYDQLERRLESRSMGLLEIAQGSMRSVPWFGKIQFLHRTVRDFLVTPGAQAILRGYTDFQLKDAHIYRCNVLVATGIVLRDMDMSDAFGDHLECFCYQVQTMMPQDASAFALWDKMLSGVKMKSLIIGGPGVSSEFAVIFENWLDKSPDPLALAIQFDWAPYVVSKLSTDPKSETPEPLLEYALGTVRGTPTLGTNLVIIKKLIEIGIDANEAWKGVSTWVKYIIRLNFFPVDDLTNPVDTISLLLQHGADTNMSIACINQTLKYICNTFPDNIPITGAEASRKRFVARLVKQCQVYKIKGSAVRYQRQAVQPCFDLFDILGCINFTIHGNLPLFKKQDIERLKLVHAQARNVKRELTADDGSVQTSRESSANMADTADDNKATTRTLETTTISLSHAQSQLSVGEKPIKAFLNGDLICVQACY